MPLSDEVGTPPAEPDPPATVFEAYRVLGLNASAPDAAVKKIVDALRMSWHPDHARDEADRRNREQRIKQINAAWDLLKGRPAAAA
jgi:DnaJ-class molecular chaperone